MKIHSLIPSILILSGVWMPVAYAKTNIDETRDAQPHGEVEVSNIAGEINVIGWDKEQIEVTGYLGDGVERLDFVQDRSHTLIKVIYPKNSRNVNGSVLNIRVPEDSDLSVNGVSADIEVSGVKGLQRLATVSGEVETEVFENDAEIKAVSGDLQVRGSEYPAFLTLTTVSGDLEVEKIAGELEMSTVSGDLEVVAGILTRARLKTTNGDISLVGILAEGGRIDAKTINGDVDIKLEGGKDIAIEIETFYGDIDSCFDAEVQRKSQYGPGRYLRFSEGEGSRKVVINTLNGDVEICAD